jgi:hypothetical protein
MSLETQLTHKLQLDWFELFNQESCATFRLVRILFSFFYFSAIHNEWFVTRRSRSSLEWCCRRPALYIHVSMLKYPISRITPPSHTQHSRGRDRAPFASPPSSARSPLRFAICLRPSGQTDSNGCWVSAEVPGQGAQTTVLRRPRAFSLGDCFHFYFTTTWVRPNGVLQ